MWTHITLHAHIVWNDVLWHARAIWEDGDHGEPVVMVKSGRVAFDPDGGPDGALLAAARALQGKALEQDQGTAGA